jgi:hypothetical protein
MNFIALKMLICDCQVPRHHHHWPDVRVALDRTDAINGDDLVQSIGHAGDRCIAIDGFKS